MPYSTPSNMLAQFDARILGDLVNDTGVRQTPTQLLSDPNLGAALSRAAGLVNAACQVGERYTQAQLAALTGDDAAILTGLNCDVAFVYLCQRRGIKSALYEEALKRSDDLLKQLRDGALIFDVSSNVGAGVPSNEFPSLQTYRTIGLLRDQASRLFPLRRPQTPATGGQTGPYSVNG